MKKRFQQNQRNKIKQKFEDYVYYKLCKTVFSVFQHKCPTMIMSAEDLFADASLVLDSILISGDLTTDICEQLWTNTYNSYRQIDGISGDKDDTKAEVAMLFYCVMFGLQSVQHSHYRGELQRILHNSIHNLYGNECFEIEKALRPDVNILSEEMFSWMKDYFVSKDSLTKLLKAKNEAKDSKASGGKTHKFFYTMQYENLNASDRRHRLQVLQMKWEEWHWISKATFNNFESLFSGGKMDCHIEWLASVPVLFALLKAILKCNFIEKQTKVSATSLVENQFKKNIDRSNRVDDQATEYIDWSLLILNPEFNLPKRFTDNTKLKEKEDVSDESFRNAIKSGELHVIKGTHR